MLSSGSGESSVASSLEDAEASAFLRIEQPHELLSPSIERMAGDRTAAFELKFLLPESLARQLETWAAHRLQRDAFADERNGGSYQTTTLYLDTPQFDVFHRSAGFRRRKYRLRRYGHEQTLFLERKTRRGDRVKKRRSSVPLADLGLVCEHLGFGEWGGLWFSQRVALRKLQPACRLTYERTAFVALTGGNPVRLTLDRHIRGAATTDWNLAPVEIGSGILPGEVVCEFKFREAMPNLFKEVIADLQLQAGSISKYRRMLTAAGFSAGSGEHD